MKWNIRLGGAIFRTLLAHFTVFAILSGLGVAVNPTPGWRSYRNSEYGFTIAYPKEFKFYAGRPDYQEAQLSYIPICDRSTVACFEYNGDKYGNMAFAVAGVSVNILRDKRTEQQCAEIDTGSFPIKEKTINGIRFRYGETGGAATSHWIGGPTYRTYREKICFELVAFITGTSSAAYDEGTVKEFDSSKLSKVLNGIVQTFRFVGHAVDGPGWKPYYDSSCAGFFEYPDTADVVKTIQNKARWDSDEITCEEYFTAQGSNYTVAAKSGFPGPLSLNSWLEKHGYPGLKSAHEEASTLYTKTYKAGPYYYIYGQTTVFIFSVTDTKHKAMDAEDDPMFRHFLRSFEAN